MAIEPLREKVLKEETIDESFIVDLEAKLGVRAKEICSTFESDFLPKMKQVRALQKLDPYGRFLTSKENREKGSVLKQKAYANLIALCQLK
ncbi:hypothetical protein A7985_08630 [Pseudoalteromonas luteoviolacea]|uniref:Uncharacterized protein n=1 Tax=Pseudoalteromonas luteoviolacea TaxID=43657 RepID=A0A1C0TXG3_9GAMM|nr:hypothetical protein [Pseudoalteromonas luteoviolacea]OCQ23987.1 hypothetical protein A7985_08630 [Pseudoalteromonas luteoviolacea]